MAYKDLVNAKEAKQDEFYTQLSDIELELKYYKEHFKDKIVFCNCDDPYESNFFKYFAMNFEFLGLKKLIATCYCSSPFADTELDVRNIFNFQEYDTAEENKNKKAYKIEITEIPDFDNNGAVDLSDVEYLLKSDRNVLTVLSGDGDFRSEECIELLKEADIVVTNPPFSLFREYVAQLIEYEKKFIIIGNQNAITYKEFFPYIQENKVWLGASIHSGDREFRIPSSYEARSKSLRIDSNGHRFIRVVGVRWWTNLDYPQRHEELILYKTYNPTDYPFYDNYDAINVNSTQDIPVDYDGIMGVPITFLDKYNPEQFEILGLSQKVGYGLQSNKKYDEYIEVRNDGTPTGSSGKKTNGNPMLKGVPKKNNYYTNGKECAYSLYGRIFIKRKK